MYTHQRSQGSLYTLTENHKAPPTSTTLRDPSVCQGLEKDCSAGVLRNHHGVWHWFRVGSFFYVNVVLESISKVLQSKFSWNILDNHVREEQDHAGKLSLLQPGLEGTD